MRRLIKKYSKHDYDNRDMAIAILDYVLYVDQTHGKCVNTHLENMEMDKLIGGDFLRPTNKEMNRSTESYIFGHIVSYDTMIKNIKYKREDFDETNWKYLTQGWEENEVRVYLEENNSLNIDIMEAIDIVKTQLPSFGYSNFTIWDDESSIDYCDDINGNEIEYESYPTWG